MAAIDMPNNPSPGDTYLAGNGINYVWDGEKWIVRTEASTGVNLWSRNPGNETLQSIYNGDSVIITDDAGATQVTLAPEGITGTYNIDGLPALP